MVDLLDDDGLLDVDRDTDPNRVVQQKSRGHTELPRSNDALEAWQAPTTDGAGCHLCGRAGRMTCEACSQAVCGAHSWVMLGLCRTCATEERVARWNKEREEGENWLS